MSEYQDRDLYGLGKHYTKHVNAMTTEGLHGKSAIAGELAYRDFKIEQLMNALGGGGRRLLWIHSIYEAALQEIQKGQGPYNPDQLKHAENCIEDMKRIATEALKLEYKLEEGE